jgi:hypothetical protein
MTDRISRRFGRASPEQVHPEDLGRLRAIHDLLATLNDPLASRPRIEKLCASMDVLAARIIAHARSNAPLKNITQLGPALSLIGNRGLEVVLLQLLEDLTTLKAELEDEQATKRRPERA